MLVEERRHRLVGAGRPSWPWSASPRRARPVRSACPASRALHGRRRAARHAPRRGAALAGRPRSRDGAADSTRPAPCRASAPCSGRRRAQLRAARRPAATPSPTTPARRSRSSPADTLAAARAGVRALALEIEPLPFVVDIEEAFRDQRIDGDPFEDSRGDVDAALAAADGRRRAPAGDAGAAADADRAARRGRVVEAGRADLLDRDAGHLRRPRRADAALRRAQGAGARDRRVHRRRLRRQAGRRASRR